ncbi:MAG TPA: hypothetical protein GX711_09205 [Clostridia bacterium]|nr:hypothetical protein [Clostridia bacterium]
MACFLVPMGEAIVTTVLQKAIEKKEKETGVEGSPQTGVKWSRKLSWLNRLLWGGVLLLALEHFWHGEIVPWPPFLTAMSNPAEVGPMLHEMATIGTGMAVFVTLVWVIMILIADLKAKAISAQVETDA